MKIFCTYSKLLPKAKKLYDNLAQQYNFVDINQADIIVCLGGDGFMLHCLHDFINSRKPIYGINCGTYGFLLNQPSNDKLLQNIENSKQYTIHPLIAKFKVFGDKEYQNVIAFNEISLLRGKAISSHIKVAINKQNRIEKLIGDGMLVSSPIGSTSYNRSCGGPILSTFDNLICLTPINTSNLRPWKGITLQDDSIIEVENICPVERPLNLAADSNEFTNIERAQISVLKTKSITILFDKHNDLESKIIKQNFGQ